MMRAIGCIFFTLGTLLMTPSFATTPLCPNTVKVMVSADGRLAIDGKPSTLATLDDRFGQAERTHAVVWYYREGATSDPSDQAWETSQAVLAKLAAHHLSISFSDKPDFSDVIAIGRDGKTSAAPRTQCF